LILRQVNKIEYFFLRSIHFSFKGIPYGTINLVWGVPSGETNITCTAGGGTFLIEFGTLSRLTGDPLYERVALRALQSIWSKRSSIDLVKEKEATN
jgi:hypothetical protein